MDGFAWIGTSSIHASETKINFRNGAVLVKADLRKVTVNVFPGGFNWGIYAGQERGFFESEGIQVELQDTPNSVQQMTDFAAGRFDIAMTAVDNIVAYVEGQGEAPIGPQPEFFGFLGSDSGFLNFVSAPDVATIAGLKGKTVSVDAFTTGYAFVLYEMLRLNGLQKDIDYKVESAGGMVQRWTALSEGRQSATLLSAPYNVIAETAGFRNLGKAVSVIGEYQGNVAAARRGWASENRECVVAFIRGYRKGIKWLYAHENRSEAVALLCRRLPRFTAETAASAYSELLDPHFGFFQDCDVRLEGVRTVLRLRQRYFPGASALSNPEKYFDMSYAERG